MASVNVSLGSQHLFARQSGSDTISASETSDLKHQDLTEPSSTSMSTPKPTAHFDTPSILLLSHARIPESATIVTVARHQSESLPYSDYSPYFSNPPTAVNSRAPKEIDSEDNFPPVKDRLKLRLSSGFFAVFLGGWADGGKSLSTNSLTCVLMGRFHSNRDRHSMYVSRPSVPYLV